MPRAHCPKLSGSSRTNSKAAGKRWPFGVESTSLERPIATAHSIRVNLCPVPPVGGYKLSGRNSGVNLTFLLDTGAARSGKKQGRGPSKLPHQGSRPDTQPKCGVGGCRRLCSQNPRHRVADPTAQWNQHTRRCGYC